MGQRKAHKLGARLQQTRVDRKVCRTSRQGLDVNTPLFGAETEGLKGALLAKCFDFVNDLVAAIIALPRVALRILVREAGSQGLHHSLRREVLAGNELDSLELALALRGDKLGHLRINDCDVSIIHRQRGRRCESCFRRLR